MTLSQELAWRGLVNQTTYPDITALDGGPVTFYWGVDPSAESMTIGNLAAALMVKRFIQHGHHAVLLVGGATGLIGDPDGKRSERDLKSPEEIAKNKARIIDQYHRLFDGQPFDIVDNYDWFKDMGYLDFLRNIGKHVPMRQMLQRDFVSSRLGEGGSGISYAEFSYVLIQAYDFLHLHEDKGVSLQLCGSDQWGNSIAGVDLIRRKTGDEAHVFSMPLVVDKVTGQKFGKTEAGAVWLDAEKTSPYEFYQYWLNVDDESVEPYLKLFTELDESAIDQVLAEFYENRGGRHAQKTLAYEVTRLVHGQGQADRQQHIAEAVTAQDIGRLTDDEVAALRQEIATAKAPEDGSIIEILVGTGLAASNSEARRLLQGGAIAVNGHKVQRDHFEKEDFVHGRLLLRRGKAFKDSALVELE